MSGRRILAAMSGGVDSSVAALLLQREGWEVIGISMDLYDFSKVTKDREGTCCSLDGTTSTTPGECATPSTSPITC